MVTASFGRAGVCVVEDPTFEGRDICRTLATPMASVLEEMTLAGAP